MPNSGIVLTGDVETFRKFLRASFTMKHVEREVRKATIDNSLFLVKKVKDAIRRRKFTQSAPLTLALSKGQIPLLKEKNLFDAIGREIKSSFEAEVGIIKGRKSTGGVGKNTGPEDIEKVALLLHEGFTIDVTQEMMAALQIALRGNKTERRSSSRKKASSGKIVTKFRVPPRRFLTAAFKNTAIQERLRRRWRTALENAWLSSGVKDGEHKERGP